MIYNNISCMVDHLIIVSLCVSHLHRNIFKSIFICRDINVPNAWEFRKDNEKYQLNLTAPGVEVHCLYGSKVQTVEKYIIFII